MYKLEVTYLFILPLCKLFLVGYYQQTPTIFVNFTRRNVKIIKKFSYILRLNTVNDSDLLVGVKFKPSG